MSEEIIRENKKRYWIERWGNPYFNINKEGHITVKPAQDRPPGDLYELITSIVQRGIEPPILLRFNGIIRDRIKKLQTAFSKAMKEFNYKNHYTIAYPIKVNPQSDIVRLIQTASNHAKNDHMIGLEVGSKPELIAVFTLEESESALLLCNGYKDADYIELALLSRQLGRRTIIIIEQAYELKLVIDIADRLGIEAEIGFRIKPSLKGSGRWQTSSGELAKFGLNTDALINCLNELSNSKKTKWLKLLHFHIGSQITAIDAIKSALEEAVRTYVELSKICPNLSIFDAGGGLGVDYNGTKTTTDSSINYTIEEYARDVVYAISEACSKSNIPHPLIVTESGRAVTAHHAILITEVIDVAPILDPIDDIPPPASKHEIPLTLHELYQELTLSNCQEALHDTLQYKEKILSTFISGELSLEERAYSEQIYRRLIAKISYLGRQLDYTPEDIKKIQNELLDLYFCNFSLFQSLPDSWAIDQLFPVVPIHRLNEIPSRHGLIVDISCDSDGTIDKFVTQGGESRFLPLHPPSTDPYYLGVFLVGAYQEVMGGLHNLFGDAHAVHVEISKEGEWEIKAIIEGDTIEEVLQYTQYHPHQILDRLHSLIEHSLKIKRLSNEESAILQKKFKQALESYTYLVV